MKAIGGLARSVTPGLTRENLSGTRNQLQPRIPEEEYTDQTWDNGTGAGALLQDISQQDDYSGTNLQLLGLDGTGSRQDFTTSDAVGAQRVIQQVREAHLGLGDNAQEEQGYLDESGAQKRRESFVERVQRLASGAGNLRSGLESDLNYPFHFLNVIMRYHDAGIIRAMLLLLIIVALIGAIWVAILEYTSLKDIFATRNIPGSLSIVNLIIALVYNTQVQQSLSSYESGPQMYLRMLNAVKSMARKFTYAVEVPRSEGFVAQGQRRRNQASRCLHSYELCKALMQFTLLLFNRETDTVRALYAESVQQRLRDCGMTASNKLVFLPTFMGFLLDDWMNELTIAKNQGLLEPTDIASLEQAAQTLRDRLDEFDSVRQIRAPDIFNNLLRMVMYFYVLFILPVSMYDDVDQLMIVSYTIVFFLVFGPIFIRWWLGDPFDKRPRYAGMAFQNWRAVDYAEVCMYQSEMRHKWMCVFPEDYDEEQRQQMSKGVSGLRAMLVQTLEESARAA